jgi:putative peptidoglycan lipid II flippase
VTPPDRAEDPPGGVSDESTGVVPATAAPIGADDDGASRPGRRIALNTAIFSIATGLSRLAGLVREIVASRYFGTGGPFSAFTLAFQIPNLLRSLVADAAISAAFVPVFTELLEQRRRREAFQLASTLFLLILIGLGAITLFFVLLAGVMMPAFTGGEFTPRLDDLTVGLSQVLFPIVVLLGLNGLVVGILNAYEHFTIPALAPLVWNLVIIGVLVALRPGFDGADQIYAYAIGVLVGTAVQFAMSAIALRRIDFRLERAFDPRDERVRQVFGLMLPVTIGLGVINFDLLINSGLGTLVSEEAPRAIDAAFRIYMLPQGMFSIALATVLFPALSRLAARRDYDGLRATTGTGVRQIFLLLVPSAAFTLALATPITRLVYERGAFDAQSTEQVAEALFWFSFSLPFAGANLLLTRTFFSLQRPWLPTSLAAGNLIVKAAVSLALYKPLGIAGLVIGTAVASIGMTASQSWLLRREHRGRPGEDRRTVETILRIALASALLGVVAWLVWRGLDEVLGRSTLGQIGSVGAAMIAGTGVYVAAVLAMRIQEARQIIDLVAGRLRREAPGTAA